MLLYYGHKVVAINQITTLTVLERQGFCNWSKEQNIILYWLLQKTGKVQNKKTDIPVTNQMYYVWVCVCESVCTWNNAVASLTLVKQEKGLEIKAKVTLAHGQTDLH